MNQEFTKVKVEGAVMEVARMGQQINHMDEKFDKLEKKMDKLLIQRFATNFHLLILGVDDKLLLFSSEVSFLTNFQLQVMRSFTPHNKFLY